MPAPKANELRSAIIRVVSQESAYQVPSYCEGIGLASGDTEESFKSKAAYVERRLAKLDRNELAQTLVKLAERTEDYQVIDLAERLEEVGQPEITGITRREIAKFLEGQSFTDGGSSFDDLELLRGVWPTQQMHDSSGWRGKSVDEVLIQTTVLNCDIGNREILEIIGFFTCSNARVFKFLLALVDPEFIGKELQQSRVTALDELLRHDGYSFNVERIKSGRNIYEIVSCSAASPATGAITDKLAAFDPTQVQPRWTKALARIDTDPEGAITAARTLLEDVLKWLTDHLGDTWQEKDDLTQLYKRVRDHLNLAPDDHTEQMFKRILGSCESIVTSLGSLRNKISDAHSTGPRRVKPAPRHAALAVNLAGTMAKFLIETWEARGKG